MLRLRLLATLTLSSFLVATLAPSRALATNPPLVESSPEERASELKRQGDAHVAALRYTDAIAAYDASYAIVPNPAVLFNKGRALQALGLYPEALDAFERFSRDASPELRAKVPGLETIVAELRGKVVALTVSSNARGARIVLRGREIGVTPLAKPVSVAGGHATIELTADGFFPSRREVDLPGGGAAVIDITLTAKATHGVVTVKSSVAGSAIFIDGKSVGTPPAEAPLEAGSHAVRVHHDGYDDAQTSVVLNAGEHKEVTLDPSSMPGLASKWWFWTGVGVIVVGGIALTAALLTEKPAGSGDYSPGRVSGPLIRF